MSGLAVPKSQGWWGAMAVCHQSGTQSSGIASPQVPWCSSRAGHRSGTHCRLLLCWELRWDPRPSPELSARRMQEAPQ